MPLIVVLCEMRRFVTRKMLLPVKTGKAGIADDADKPESDDLERVVGALAKKTIRCI
jgi:hypothetical protein